MKKQKNIYIAQFGHFGYSWIIVADTKENCIEKIKNHSALRHKPKSYIEDLPKEILFNEIYSDELFYN